MAVWILIPDKLDDADAVSTKHPRFGNTGVSLANPASADPQSQGGDYSFSPLPTRWSGAQARIAHNRWGCLSG
jgi:hypothetical protein